MFKSLQRFLPPAVPVNKDDQRLVLIVLGVSLAAASSLWAVGINRTPMMILVPCLLVALGLAGRGYLKPAGFIAPLSGLAVFTYQIFTNYGVRDVSMLALPVVIVAAGLMYGRWGTLFFGGASLLIILALGLAETTGWIQNALSEHNSWIDYVAASVAIVLMCLLQWAVIGRLQDNIRRAQRELSERQQAEAALRESETRYRLISSQTSDYAYAFHLTPTGDYVRDWTSEAFERITGYPLDDPRVSNGLVNIIYPPDRAILEERNQRVAAGQSDVSEFRIVRKDGAVRWLSNYAHPVRDETTGRVVRTYGAVQDITDRKQAEESLQRSAARLEVLHEIDRNILTAQSLEEIAAAALGRIRRLVPCVRASVSLFEFPTRETVAVAVSQDTPTRFGPGSRGSLEEYGLHIIAQLQRGELYRESDEIAVAGGSAENQQFATEGVRAWLIAPLQHQGELIGALNLGRSEASPFTAEETAIVGDVASPLAIAIQQARLRAHLEQFNAELEERVRQRTDELSAANVALAKAARMKDEFLASMSHELRTPLTGILAFSQTLQTPKVYGALNERQLKAVKAIEDSGRHLLELINDILDLSKIEAGKLELTPGVVLVEELCQTSVRLVKQMASAKRQQLNYQVNPVDLVFIADARRLKQMLVNLLSNAVKFTPDGGSVGLEVVGDSVRREVRFTVWDTGIGIAPADIQRLFQAFVQLDSRLAREYSGTGLGLALVRRMAEMHGGRVSVTSEVGVGSRFIITLPWMTNEVATRQGA